MKKENKNINLNTNLETNLGSSLDTNLNDTKLRNEKIDSDFNLILSLLKEFIIFIFKLPFLILIIIYSLIILDFKKVNSYLEKIVFEPFKIIFKILYWFFQAKYTAFLIIFLIFIYILQFVFLIPNNLFNFLLFSPKDIFSFSIYTVITSIFLHANFSHLFGNLLALLIFGRIVEAKFKSKMIFIFLISGIIANIISGLISIQINDFRSSLGASGGIAGLIILAILLNPFKFTTIFIIPMPIFLIGWVLIFLDISGLTNPSTTNHIAHIGGYLSLLIIFFFFEYKNKKNILKGFFINLLMLFIIYYFLKYLNLNLNIIKSYLFFN